ncbi:MAG: hypothetical protein H5U05_10750 [Candidatus Aminicenantes bacterium]|nr:hypothetical protein [Candidatus Aminicenantes bacterium]
MKTREWRVVVYPGENTWTPGWRKMYDIQPSQAWANSDIDELEDFVDVVREDVEEREDWVEMPDDVYSDFVAQLRAMLKSGDSIGVLTIEVEDERA